MIVFIYQIVTKPLTSKIIPNEICPSCSKNDSIELTLYMRYIAMGIPIFGMGRRTGVICTSCGSVLKNPDSSIFARKKYSDTVAAAVKEIRANHKRTLWQLVYPWSIWFVIPVLILILLVISSINKKATNEKAKEYAEILMHPQPGDIYKATWYENNLSTGVLIKLIRIDGDTLFIAKTKKNIQMSFAEKDWNTLTEDPAAFETKEYKIKKFSLLKETNFGNFFMYNADANKKDYPVFLGSVLNSKSEMDLGFETIERKK
ncbi:hypothetical protein [[Flexibacter] sp. ATCC 35103]|uniref:hypothetical protein n=1 Tax=[Flexibacter] sp. ATCC 35103 TaxID=1937528 RepID=UPI0009D2B460|nr:hypothetical protein [[Flexibacter] sp. ATCC 35103]OMQ12960.1 hypothetical protein BXU01_00230 [[Flexibacter] sp. ATCC 35103]